MLFYNRYIAFCHLDVSLIRPNALFYVFGQDFWLSANRCRNECSYGICGNSSDSDCAKMVSLHSLMFCSEFIFFMTTDTEKWLVVGSCL